MKKSSFLAFISIWMFFLLALVYAMPSFDNTRDTINYIVLLVSYVYVPFLYLVLANRMHIDFFEPLNIFFAIYFLMYTITPLVLIIQDNTLCCGVDVMDGCVEATLIYMLSLTVLCFSYYSTFRTRVQVSPSHQEYALDESGYTDDQKKRILQIAILGWCACYLISLFFLRMTGRSLTYILTLGFMGETTEASELSISFLENVTYGMIGFWLYICATSKSKLLKIAIGFLTATAYMIRGFRFVVVIMFAAYFIMQFARKNQRPKIRQCIPLLLLLFVYIGVMGFMRNDLRSGTSTDWSSISLDTFTYALYSNFNIYQIYYGIVNSLPEKHAFAGLQMSLEGAAVFIPRILWSGKPLAEDAISIKLIAVSVSDYAIYHANMATPDLGAYYMQFGVVGCILYSFGWGKLCRWVRDKFFRESYNLHNLIAFSVFVPALFQIIIRGGEIFNLVKKIGFFFVPLVCMLIAERCGWFNARNGEDETSIDKIERVNQDE